MTYFFTRDYLLKAGINIGERSDMILCTLKTKRNPQEGAQEKFKCKISDYSVSDKY